MFAKLPAAVAAIVFTASAAHATDFDMASVNRGLTDLSQWNTIVFGDLKASSDTFGRAFVGHDFKGTTEFWANPMGSAQPGLVVVNNVTGGTVHLSGGGADIGGALLNGATLEAQGAGAVTVGVNGAALNSQLTLMKSDLTTLSGYLATLPGAAPTVVPNSSSFVVAPGTNFAVFTVDSLASLANADPHFTLNGADTVVINVGGTNVGTTFNFNGYADIAQHVIWNFYEAQTIDFNRQFWGAVLAPLAAATSTSEITGVGVFDSFTQNAQMHTPNFTGTFRFPEPPTTPPTTPGVPEPSTWALLIMGFGAAGSMIRRRRAVAA